jgi:hypothetical protein
MSEVIAPTTVLTGFFTSQKWLRGRSLSELEGLLGYRPGRLSTKGASVYAFTRVPENWEFDLKGYTNVPGGMNIDPKWVAADLQASAYYARTGVRSSETVLKDNSRASMTASGPNRLIKVKPLLLDPDDPYPPGKGIPQWRVSELAAQRKSLHGDLFLVIKPGDAYPK